MGEDLAATVQCHLPCNSKPKCAASSDQRTKVGRGAMLLRAYLSFLLR